MFLSVYMNAIPLHRCLAHVIESAAQAVISTRSKSKYYSGDPEDDNLPEYLGVAERDEIGIIRAICIEVCNHFLFHPLFLT